MGFKYLVVCVLIVLSAVAQVVTQETNVAPPLPALEWLLTYSADFNWPVDTGEGPSGRRQIFALKSGKFTGPKLNGGVFAIVPKAPR
jgi:hypothetical protein